MMPRSTTASFPHILHASIRTSIASHTPMPLVALFVAALVLLQTSAGSAQIVIDGRFDDWSKTPATIIDPSDAPEAFIDFGEVRISHDDRFVHLLIDFGKTVNVQGLDGHAMILLDCDGDAKTGKTIQDLAGVDVIIDLTPPGKNPGVAGIGIALRSTTYEPDPADPTAKALNPYDIGFTFAPTCASRRFEFRIDRSAALPNTPPLFQGDHFTGKLVFFGLDGAIADETEPFTHQLDRSASPATLPGDSVDPFVRGPKSNLRVLSWNIQRGAIFLHPEPFARSLAAIGPDVILLQELADKNSAEQLHDFLTKALPPKNGEDWHVAFGAGGGGGDLRCAVATRFALAQVETLARIPQPGHPDHLLRAIGAMADVHGKHLLVVSAHLKCCGRADGPEDKQRKLEAQAIHDAVKSAESAGGIDGVIIAGDFNLVGSREPVEIMAAGLDLDRSNLTIDDQANQLDGLTNATWSDPNQPFTPGRLDYLLFTDSALAIARSFVFDAHDLSANWLAKYNVQPTDSVSASDHMPIVADLAWVHEGH